MKKRLRFTNVDSEDLLIVLGNGAGIALSFAVGPEHQEHPQYLGDKAQDRQFR